MINIQCRICGSTDLTKYLDLGTQPLANSLVKPGNSDLEENPLQVYFCNDCSFSQLGEVVDPHKMYTHYLYQSSVSEHFKGHCIGLAETLKKMIGKQTPWVIDVACNDGCLMKALHSEGFKGVGIEPAENLAKIARSKKIDTISDYWSRDLALGCHYDVVTALNVFAHIDDLKEFCLATKKFLMHEGILVIEVPWLLNTIFRNQFDTIYHEHLSYFSLKAIDTKLTQHGLKIFKAEIVKMHGGSLRIYACKESTRKEESSVELIRNIERACGLHELDTYMVYKENVARIKRRFLNILESVNNKKVVGYGACAKGISLINYCGITTKQIQAIADDTKDKQGLETPGSRIPIISSEQMKAMNPDYIVLLAWNFTDELKNKTQWFKGKYILTMPRARIE